MDDRAGSAALILALRQTDPATVKNRVTFAWVVEEEIGLNGAAFLASRMTPDHAFAVDTFVSTDAPLDVQHLAHAELGKGAVLRGLDSRTVTPATTIDRIVSIAQEANIPLQIGVTQGGTDASAFSAAGAVDAGLSWPGRYSHSPVEVIDRRDLEALAKLIATLARQF
jgi:putative aminopeptidase FrvX